jgi:outer membrane lipopolysaccharide assembly protein LptE/RlpB
MRLPIPLLFFLSLSFLALSGCGYHFFSLDRLTKVPAARQMSFGKTVRIAVKTFHNNTLFPLVESTVTQALKDTLLRTSGVILVNDPKHADIVLWGKVMAVAQMPLALSSVNGIQEYQMEIILDAHATGYNGTELWHGGSIIGTSINYVSLNLSLFQTTQQYAINTAAMNASVRLVNFMAHSIGSTTFNPLSLQNQVGASPLTPGSTLPNGSAVPGPAPGGAP